MIDSLVARPVDIILIARPSTHPSIHPSVPSSTPTHWSFIHPSIHLLITPPRNVKEAIKVTSHLPTNITLSPVRNLLQGEESITLKVKDGNSRRSHQTRLSLAFLRAGRQSRREVQEQEGRPRDRMGTNRTKFARSVINSYLSVFSTWPFFSLLSVTFMNAWHWNL